MSTRRQRRKKLYNYCMDCGRKFKHPREIRVMNHYEPRDCTYGTVSISSSRNVELFEGTGRVVCLDCFNEKRYKQKYEKELEKHRKK